LPRLASLHKDTGELVLDIMESTLASNPYQELEKRLLKFHTLDKYQSFERLLTGPLSQQ
jgi:hypothetical protein